MSESDHIPKRLSIAVGGNAIHPAGSIGPKVEAAIRFIEGGGKRVIIGHLDQALDALAGKTGTHIVRDDD